MVTGTAAKKLSADGKAAVDQYRQYLEAQTAALVPATKAFTDAVDAGDVEQAKALYAPARVAYERIEPVAETFGDETLFAWTRPRSSRGAVVGSPGRTTGER